MELREKTESLKQSDRRMNREVEGRRLSWGEQFKLTKGELISRSRDLQKPVEIGLSGFNRAWGACFRFERIWRRQCVVTGLTRTAAHHEESLRGHVR
jgi:hypothetical protein